MLRFVRRACRSGGASSRSPFEMGPAVAMAGARRCRRPRVSWRPCWRPVFPGRTRIRRALPARDRFDRTPAGIATADLRLAFWLNRCIRLPGGRLRARIWPQCADSPAAWWLPSVRAHAGVIDLICRHCARRPCPEAGLRGNPRQVLPSAIAAADVRLFDCGVVPESAGHVASAPCASLWLNNALLGKRCSVFSF